MPTSTANRATTEGHTERSTCPIANGLEILGDRWTLLIFRDLLFTNRNEFGHLLNAGEGISTNILTDRLQRLQGYGLVEKMPHPTNGRKCIYRLTDEALGLGPTLIELAAWSKGLFNDSFIPPPVAALAALDRDAIVERLRRREPLVVLDL